MSDAREVCLLKKTDAPTWYAVRDAMQEKFPRAQSKYTTRMDSLVLYHLTVRIRLEYARSFVTRVLASRADRDARRTARRDFEAWLFFARSALDCEAVFANELCQLGPAAESVDIRKVEVAAKKSGNWPELADVLRRHIGTQTTQTWFGHFNELRRAVTHREVVPLTIFGHAGSVGPTLPDFLFVPANPVRPREVREEREWGIGQYSKDKQTLVEACIADVESVLLGYLGQGTCL